MPSNPNISQIVWNEMKQVIATHWSELDPEQMSQCFVQWDEYAGGDPRPLPEDI
jgi:PBP1b-binding outer membrane lipoprotein LpoB